VCDLETTKILVNEEKAKAHWGAVAPRKKMQERDDDACGDAFGHDAVFVVKENIPGSWAGEPADRIAVKMLYAKYC
jgi:hypothetical protein